MVSESAGANGISINRVDAINGQDRTGALLPDYDERRFLRWHGQRASLGEYGCYMSHLKALETFLAGNHAYGVIAEDDVLFDAEFRPRLEAVIDAAPKFDAIKLFNFRVPGFVGRAVTSQGDSIGLCLGGKQGSSAAYLVSRQGAAALLAAMKPMWLPHDFALERSWGHGVHVQTVKQTLVRLGAESQHSTVADLQQQVKRQRTFSLLFDMAEALRRAAYVLRRQPVPAFRMLFRRQ